MTFLIALLPVIFLQGEATTSEDTVVIFEEETTSQPAVSAIDQYEDCVGIMVHLLCSIDCTRDRSPRLKEEGLLGELVRCIERARELGEGSGDPPRDGAESPPP